MKIHLIVFGLTILLICVGFSGFPAIAMNTILQRESILFSDGNTLYVGGDGPGNYTRIQDAIDDAEDGDTVFVYDDSSPYYENLIVGQDNGMHIDLIGENRETTIIDGGGNGDVIHIGEYAYGIKVSGFTIQNAGDVSGEDAGIEILTSYNTINDNIIINNGYCGVHCLNEGWDEFNSITDNIIMYNQWGIVFDETQYNIISGNYISNNTHGIYIGLFNLPTLDITSSVSEPFFNDVYNNVITNNSEDGIVVLGYWYVNIFQNTITKNDYGISIDAVINSDCVTNEIYDNEIISNLIGIRLISEPFGSVVDCSVYENRILENEVGIYMDSAGYGDIGNNKIWNNSISDNLNGIFIEGDGISENDIWSNNILKNNDTGVWFNMSYSNHIRENNLIDNGENAGFNYKRHLFKGNEWNGNYWSDYPGIGVFPMIIHGKIDFLLFFTIPWINIDWHPAQEPYDIGV